MDAIFDWCVGVLVYFAGVFGITYKEDKPFVERAVRDLVEQGVYPPSLWEP